MTILSHEFANIFPMMGEAEYAALVEDMRQNGYDAGSPITLYDKKILDGRNRYRAARELGIVPVYSQFEGDDSAALAFAIRANLHRRHLDSSQRAAIATELEVHFAEIARRKQLEAASRGGAATKDDYKKVTEIIPQPFYEKNIGEARAQAAEAIGGTNPHYVSDAKRIKAEAPQVFEKIKAGEITIPEAKREIRRAKTEEARAEIAEVGRAAQAQSERYSLLCADIRSGLPEVKNQSIDVIITDPPYPEKYIPLYDDLARLAARVLKPGGLCVVMIGQSYMPEIMALMKNHLRYHWVGAYLTPGAQSAQIWPRKVNPFWKPLLIFCNGEYGGGWFGDVVKSAVNDNDKSLHEWGQSESGMAEVVEKWSSAGDKILDPFCGAGTTGVCALRAGRLFVGADVSQEQIDIANGRMRIG